MTSRTRPLLSYMSMVRLERIRTNDPQIRSPIREQRSFDKSVELLVDFRSRHHMMSSAGRPQGEALDGLTRRRLAPLSW